MLVTFISFFIVWSCMSIPQIYVHPVPSVLKETRHLVLAYNILYEQAVKALPSGIHTVCMHYIRVFPIESISIAPPPHTSLCCYNMILKSALNCLSTLNL